MSHETIVRMGEIVIARSSASVLTALGLGSCIGVCAYDPQARIGGMAHVVLPAALGKGDNASPAKSADVGLPNLMEAMVKAGASRSCVKIAVAGGAQVFRFNNADCQMDIGARNIEAVENILASMRVSVVASDVGGSTGRTIRLYADTGTVTLRRVGEQERVLANLSAVLRTAA